DEGREAVLLVRGARHDQGRERRRRRRLLRRLLRLRPLAVSGDGEVLTPAAHAQLGAELEQLEGPKRKAVIEAIATARAHGDPSENFEYHAAKNEQGMMEARIRVLRHRLQNATIVDEAEAAASGVITVGSKVELERDDGTA